MSIEATPIEARDDTTPGETATATSRAVVQTEYGGPEVLRVVHRPIPEPGPNEVRVRVTAAGLNPVDWKIASRAEVAERFGASLPTGFGNDFAGVVDAVGEDVERWQPGDRVFGGARGRAVAEHVIVPADSKLLHGTPDDLPDAVAGSLTIAGRTADGALRSLGLAAGETLLVGGAAGGVGVLLVQLARLRGIRVIGTASPSTFDFLRGLGAEPVAYGEGLADRVRELAPDGIQAAADLHGTEVVTVARELGVAPSRIGTIAANGAAVEATETGSIHAAPDALERIAAAIVAGTVRVPIAATFSLDEIREAVALQRDGHVHGKVVVIVSDGEDDGATA